MVYGLFFLGHGFVHGIFVEYLGCYVFENVVFISPFRCILQAYATVFDVVFEHAHTIMPLYDKLLCDAYFGIFDDVVSDK